MASINIVSVSWGDHLTFGDGDGRLDTPDAVRRRMHAWRDELGAGALHWRLLRTRIPGRFYAARGYRHPSQAAAERVVWDDFDTVPALARECGLDPWLYVSAFDEGFPLAAPGRRASSFHNAMHGQHVAWQSDLTRAHPEWVVIDRAERHRQWGVLCLAYPEARQALIQRWVRLIEATEFAGLFVCLRSQSRPAEHGDQFGFNEPVTRELARRHGVDVLREPFDVQAWRDLLGEYLTLFVAELRSALRRISRGLGVGVPRGDVLGPPLGNTTLAWREWVARDLIDMLVAGQNSSQCPSMWHQLWPMHRGGGYVQNYLDGDGLPALVSHLEHSYRPAFAGSRARLWIARQWSPRSADEEAQLMSIPGVSGLVFSSFRHDNPAAIARGDWRAGRDGAHKVPARSSAAER